MKFTNDKDVDNWIWLCILIAFVFFMAGSLVTASDLFSELFNWLEGLEWKII